MDLTIHEARLDTTGELVDIGIAGRTIAYVGPPGIPPGNTSLRVDGAMISPPLIDPHFHLENSLWAEHENKSGTLREAIEVAARIKDQLTRDDILSRSTQALREALRHGTLWMRAHVDIDQHAELHLFESVVAVREKFSQAMDIQVVAFPQFGLADNPEAVDLMWQAMEQGADVVGGMPHGEKDMDRAARHIEIAFQIAKAHDADIDMHVDETDNPYWHTLEILAEKTLAEGYQGRVTAAHCCAMAAWDDGLFERVAAKVKQAQVNIVSNVPVNLLIQGRTDGPPVRRGIARVKDLLAAGVNVSCGQDDLRNLFYPFGKMDMLEVANFVAHAAHLSSPAEILAVFDMPRYRAAQVLRLSRYGIAEGNLANLIVIDACSALDAIRRQPDRLHVIRQGELIVQTERRTWYKDTIPA